MTDLRGSKAYGSRYANRVRVNTPQGSCFDGQVGVVVRVESDTVFVRLPSGVIPFAISELEVIS